MKYQVIDNFLPEPQFEQIKGLLAGNHFPWYYGSYISGNDTDENLYYFIHTFFSRHTIQSQYFDAIHPLIDRISPIALYRIKANLYPNVNKYIQHGMHQDLEVPHKGAVFYVNTNNGHTVLEDGTKIESVENRILFFDSSKMHSSTSCTDQKTRITINMNYF